MRSSQKVLVPVLLLLMTIWLVMLPDMYLMAAHDELGCKWWIESFYLAFLIGIIVVVISRKWMQITISTILLLITMIEVLSVYTYYNYMNAISFPAFMYANSSEMDDMTYYIIHYALKHEVLPVLLYICIIVLCSINDIDFYIKKRARIGVMVSGIVIISLLSIFLANSTNRHSPYHIMKELYTAIQQGQIREKELIYRESFMYGAQNTDTISNKLFIVGIGESMNYEHCSFNKKYIRNTTPQIEALQNTIFYSDYYATATYTEQSLPLILTRATPEDITCGYRELPITAAFQEAGFYTVVISHKSQIMNNGVDGYLSDGADTTIYVESDKAIIAQLKKIVKKEGNIFILLHFMGSHFFYWNYPPTYNKWVPSFTYNKEVESDSLFINAYDNSLLYADSLLSACVTSIETTHKVASFLFTSDHGEYLDNHVGGHGMSCEPSKEEYHVPLIIWYSNEYQNRYPNKIKKLVENQDKPINADCVFWSLLGMANVTINQGTQRSLDLSSDSLFIGNRTLLLPDMRTIINLK